MAFQRPKKVKTKNEVYQEMLRSLPDDQREMIWEELKHLARERQQERMRSIRVRKVRYLKDQKRIMKLLADKVPNIPYKLIVDEREAKAFEKACSNEGAMDRFLKERGY